jgi:hypothetical protein
MNMSEVIKAMILSMAGKCSFANIVTVTEPKLTKKSRTNGLTLQEMFGHSHIVKVGERNVSIGNQYENAVVNRGNKVGIDEFDFTASPRTWGTRIDNSAIIEHKNEFYLEYFYLNANPSNYQYVWEDGSTLTEEEMAIVKVDFLPVNNGSRKQEESGIDKEDQVIINTVKIDNILSIKSFGKEYNRELIIK